MKRRTEASTERAAPESRHLESGPAEADSAFDALLRDAAQLTDVAGPGATSPLVLGGTLAGGRLQVLRYLGRGGMGVVYEAFDAERRSKVALKLLLRLGADAIYRLKNEFRALADLTHPNLVPLHELFAEGDRWYYTMALVDGIPFDRYVRPDGALHIARLRSCLDQLFGGVTAVHHAGKLHRDLKPSNVLVTAAGELVVLDFGLSIDATAGGVGQTVSEQMLCGTPAYMAPEQAAGRRLCPESDLYAIGVMLFEALTGRLPFVGSVGEMLAAKQRDEAPRASTLDANVPADLDVLCASLLACAPEDRSRPPREVPAPSAAVATPRLFGREVELEQLRSAYAASCAGTALSVRIVGESGIGKSALAETFFEELRTSNALLLRGRCYERESVPFKLFDPLVDALSRALRRLPAEAQRQLVPADAFALCCLFPVLGRVPAFQVPAPTAVPDARELRQRAVPALFELLRRLRAERPLVIFLDDLQWADGDSLSLLQELLGNRAGFPGLLVAGHRIETRMVRLDAVFDAAHDLGSTTVQTLTLGPLAQEAAEQLVASFARRATTPPADFAAIARESGGHPLFATELAQFAARSNAATSLDAAIAGRVASLPSSARRVLETLALSAEPLLARIALQAADARHDDLEQLMRGRLVRISGSSQVHGSGKLLECFHDRVREAVTRELDDARRRARARRLAEVLERLDDASAELMRRCLFEAGEVVRAAALAAEAARVAASAMAFERAAELYEQALRYCDPADRALQVALGRGLGEALRFGGRTLEAAAAFRTAAELAPETEARPLLQVAGELLLVSGAHTEGMGLLNRLCAEAKVHVPRGSFAAAAELALMRARMRIRDFGLRPRTKAANPARMALLETVSAGMSNYEPLGASVVSHQLLKEALDHGHPRFACVALLRCANIDARIGRSEHQVEVYFTRLRKLLASEPKLNHPFNSAFEHLTRGTLAVMRADFPVARRHLLAVLEGDPYPGAFTMTDYAHFHLLHCYWAMGDYAAIVRMLPPIAQQMLLHGRGLAGALMTNGPSMLAWLVPDDPDAAERRVREVRHRLRDASSPPVLLLSFFTSDVNVLMYRGKFGRALELAMQHLQLFEKSDQLRQYGKNTGSVVAASLAGMCALGLLGNERGGPRASLRAQAERSIQLLTRTRRERWDEMAIPFTAALAVDRGDHESAIALLRTPTTRWASGAPYGARQIVLGKLIGGDEGRALIAAGRALLREQGVVNEEAFLHITYPGCSPR